MKTTTTFRSGAVLAPALAAAAAAAQSAPPLVFDPPSVDFGVVAPGAKLETDALLVNVTDAPVSISRSGTSCGCTTATDLAGQVVPPKGVIPFHVAMNVKSGLGEKLERFYVVVPSLPEPLALDLRAEAALPVRAIPPYIDATAAREGTITLEAADGQPFRVLSAGGAAPRFAEGEGAPAARQVLAWSVPSDAPAGSVPWFWIVETDRGDAPIVDVRLRHPTTLPEVPKGRPWVPLDQRVVVGVVPAGPIEAETTIEYARGRAPEPETVAVAGDAGWTVELLGVDGEGQKLRVRMRLTPLEPKVGLVQARAVVRASGFEAPLLVFGRVEAPAVPTEAEAPAPEAVTPEPEAPRRSLGR